MGTANSSFTWPRKWPTASPACGLLRLSLLCLIRDSKGKAAQTRCAFPFFSGRRAFSKVSFRASQVRSPYPLLGLLGELFPLDCARGFGADIVYHPCHSRHFVDDPGRDTF